MHLLSSHGLAYAETAPPPTRRLSAITVSTLCFIHTNMLKMCLPPPPLWGLFLWHILFSGETHG